ncbi:MAG: 16S rRNA (cytosine(1402)-N(4))-methyltransferase RsmH [Phycisphaerales bacterium]
MNGTPIEHIPVFADTLAERISLPTDGVMVDATIGHGGHSLLFGRTLGPEGTILGLDLDEKSIQRAQLTLKELTCRVILENSNFTEVDRQISKHNLGKVDFILADLGLCSGQLEDEERGLSFTKDMPLDMRIDRRIKSSAADIINKADEKALADLIYKFGQDRASRRIARFIVNQRQTEPIKTTAQLANVVRRALAKGKGHRWQRIDPATRTFQALRIAVNSELENLEVLLGAAPGLLADGGYFAVISFHSLEDRLVKFSFKDNKKAGLYDILTKKPITPSKEEIESNPRARSAKLRIARMISRN